MCFDVPRNSLSHKIDKSIYIDNFNSSKNVISLIFPISF